MHVLSGGAVFSQESENWFIEGRLKNKLAILSVWGLPKGLSMYTDIRISVRLKFYGECLGKKCLKRFIRGTIMKKRSHHWKAKAI